MENARFSFSGRLEPPEGFTTYSETVARVLASLHTLMKRLVFFFEDFIFIDEMCHV